MDISYDLIIKYLCQNKSIENNENNENIYEYKTTLKNNYNNNFSLKISKILNEYNRYGITIYDNNNNNISFWTSLLELINNNSNISLDNDDISQVNIFKNNLLDKYSKSKLFIKQDKGDIRELFKLNPQINILQYISDILNYTILICDMIEDNIYIVYNSTFINPKHNIILLSKYNDLWEPIMKNNKKIFNYDELYNILQLNNILYYENLKTIKFNNDIIQDKINKTILTKMKINEIIELCEQKNIILPEKYNKNILIKLVLENI